MQKIILITLIILLPIISAQAKKKVLYNEDNRSLISDLSQNYSSIKNLAHGVGSFILNNDLTIRAGIATVESFTMEELDLCPTERFAKFPAMSYCSGFLVGEKYMLTAGHCVDEYLCPEMSVAFNYHQKRTIDGFLNFNSNNIYGCKKVVKRVKDLDNDIDFALIELKRKVKGRPILNLASIKPFVGENIYMIGFPSGLPQVLTDQAKIFTLEKNTFKTNLDAFAGNSGSPIFNQTGNVIGILIEGSTDTYIDRENKCERVRVCKSIGDEDCNGERGLYTNTFLLDLVNNLKK